MQINPWDGKNFGAASVRQQVDTSLKRLKVIIINNINTIIIISIINNIKVVVVVITMSLSASSSGVEYKDGPYFKSNSSNKLFSNCWSHHPHYHNNYHDQA